MTFKLNDKIRLVNSPYYITVNGCIPELANGMTGVIVAMEDGGFIDVRMDSGFQCFHEDDTWPFTENEIELVI